MKDIFFKNISEERVKICNGKATIFVKNMHFNGNELNTLSKKLKYLINIKDHLEVKISIKSKIIADMPTIAVFEYLIYYSMKNSNHKFKIGFNPKQNDYNSNFLSYSIISEFIKSSCHFKKAKINYINKFESEETFITSNNYRKLIKNNSNKNDVLNSVASEINIFLKQKMTDYGYKEDYCESISELCANALDHTKSDCILSMISREAYKSSDNSKCHILSVVVSNISENLIFENLKKMHKSEKYSSSVLEEAMNNHKGFFGKAPLEYNEDRFYTVSIFQNGISTRENQSGSGGTGLFKTINNILGRTSNDLCYVLSGSDILYLKEDKIMPNDGYIGFNTEHNYINKVPDEDMFCKSGMYYNGTLIYLMLVLDKEDKDYDKSD